MFGGSSNVAPYRIQPSVFQQLYVGDDEVIPYLQQFSERVHKHGAAIMCQITHLGRRGEPYATGCRRSDLRPYARRSTGASLEGNGRRRYRPCGRSLWTGRPALQGGRGLDGVESLGNSHLIGQFLVACN